MKILKPLASGILLALATAVNGAQLDTTSNESAMLKGSLGLTTSAGTLGALKNIITTEPAFKATGNEGFSVQRQWTDKLGKRHTHFNQTINGLPVYGAGLIVHGEVHGEIDSAATAKNDSGVVTDQARIYAVSGTLAVNAERRNDSKSFTHTKAARKALWLARQMGQSNEKPELAYVYLPQSDETKLAWRVEISWNNGGEDFGRDDLFFDAKDAALLTRHAKVHSAKSWSTHSLENQFPAPDTLPGTLLCANEQSCGGDDSAQRAHDGAESVYDFYLDRFGRKGIDDNDMTAVSSVHLGVDIGNAFWTGAQMIYGDGDGFYLKDMTLAFDIIGHELTHGVTQYTANLVYANASGALNEAFSDILGAAAKAYHLGTTQPTWLLGQEVLTDNFPRDAFRYMNNPTLDNYSRDWWPERIPYTTEPGRDNDQGGVHGNSGIANLAFVLLTDGGKHPRKKSPLHVPSLGLAKSEQIFYRALSTYLTPSSDFAAARAATTQAAYDLYGPREINAVNRAWCAVGVGECPIKPECAVEPWVNNIAYKGGERTEVEGVIYEAKWWTQAQDPSARDVDWYVWQVAEECLL
ncbi:MAG: M4 family metallopeptidase [Algicola sp.]|nr:M4 family metallopeptidase [Algicola sp.]